MSFLLEPSPEKTGLTEYRTAVSRIRQTSGLPDNSLRNPSTRLNLPEGKQTVDGKLKVASFSFDEFFRVPVPLVTID